MQAIKIAAFDLASNVGVAIGCPGEQPSAWSYRLPKTGDDVGEYLDHFRRWLVETLIASEPSHLYFEAPFIGHTSGATARKLMSLCGVTEMIAYQRQIEYFEVVGSEVTAYFTGRARYPGANPNQRRRAKKNAVMAKCRALGWEVEDDDAGDAAAVFCFAEHLLCPGLREIKGLFGRSAA